MTSKQLMQSILQLAISGKLVEQRPEEGTAEELYSQIQEEKARLIKEKKLKKEKPFTPISDDEIPFEIPESWKWVRLGDISLVQTGTTPPTTDQSLFGSDIPFVKPGDICNENIIYRFDGLSTKGIGSSRLAKKHSILMVCIGGSIGKAAVAEKDVCFNQQINSATMYEGLCYAKYIFFSMLTAFFQNSVISKATGTATPIIKKSSWEKLMIPLPPLSEQKRIVAKIEELKPLVETYGNAYVKLENLDLGFKDQIKKSILQYAIQGKLVEQRPEEGTAEELYSQIQEEKARLIKEKKLKKEKPFTPISDDEIPFEIPESWKWVRLGDISLVQTGTTPPTTDQSLFGSDIPFVKPGDICNENIIYRFDGLSTKGIGSSRLAKKHSILMVCIGGSIGKAAVAEKDVCFNQQINSATMYEGLCYAKYIFFSMLTAFFQNSVISKATGTATPIIKKSSWEKLMIPLPPLSEQKRIVAKIEEVFALCDDLK